MDLNLSILKWDLLKLHRQHKIHKETIEELDIRGELKRSMIRTLEFEYLKEINLLKEKIRYTNL